MAVSYDKLLKILEERNISHPELSRITGVSANILTRIRRDEYISLESIEKICDVLEVGVDDVLEFVEDKDIR